MKIILLIIVCLFMQACSGDAVYIQQAQKELESQGYDVEYMETVESVGCEHGMYVFAVGKFSMAHVCVYGGVVAVDWE